MLLLRNYTSKTINPVKALCCFVIFVKLNEFVAVPASTVNFEACVGNQFHFRDVNFYFSQSQVGEVSSSNINITPYEQS